LLLIKEQQGHVAVCLLSGKIMRYRPKVYVQTKRVSVAGGSIAVLYQVASISGTSHAVIVVCCV